MNLLDDSDYVNGKYCIIEEYDMEVLEDLKDLDNLDNLKDLDNLEGLECLDSVEIIDTAHDTEITALNALGTLCELSEVELIEALTLEGCSEHETQQMREINQNSGGNEKLSTADIRVEFCEIELPINTSTVDEVVFKKHRVEIIDKCLRVCIMEGVVVGYKLVGRVYDPDIVLEFEDGRSFYNENFGYLMRFYI